MSTAKPLSALAIAELGISELMAGKAYAYTAIMSGDVYGLGLAVANEPGYHPIPLHWANFPTFDSAHGEADRLNRELLDLNERAAARIVCSSMAAGRK
jgi:hypothetical protein